MDIYNLSQDEGKNYLKNQGILEYLGQTITDQIKPNYSDLARLHQIVLQRKVFTILEFGIGWSTIVLAHALSLNKKKWDNLENKPLIRNQNMFQIFSVDSSKKWVKVVNGLIPKDFQEYINISYSTVTAGLFNGRLCHFYDTIPDLVPDLIYLDGPDPATVSGSINGLSWQNKDRTVMSGDILRMESTLLPGTFIVVDGRSNNVRFLKNNLQRNWLTNYHPMADVSTLELSEDPLGKINRETLLYCLGEPHDKE